MNVYVKPNEAQAKWKKITISEAIKDLEEAGYWKKGSTEAMLKEGHELWTPFAYYKMSDKSLNGLIRQGLEQELRLEIKRNLDKCNPSATPKVCSRIHAPSGYQNIEAQIIKMMIRDQIGAGACISQIETELL